jgi:3-oxoacyl-(acyl-carrier-protein) synthase
MEARALRQAFGHRLATLPVHSIKPIVGHTLGASGLLEALVVLECLRRRLAPPTLTSKVSDPDCDGLFIPTEGPVALPRARTALKLSSGFGGSNAALVLSCA